MFFSPKGGVFPLMKAEFWNKTVVVCCHVRELALRHNGNGQYDRASPSAIMSGVFNVFSTLEGPNYSKFLHAHRYPDLHPRCGREHASHEPS